MGDLFMSIWFRLTGITLVTDNELPSLQLMADDALHFAILLWGLAVLLLLIRFSGHPRRAWASADKA